MEAAKGSFKGYPPTVTIQPIKRNERPSEKALYETIWKNPDYRVVSPGEEQVRDFLVHCQPKRGDTLIDFGCGSGRATLALKEAGLDARGIDIADNCLDAEVRDQIGLQVHDLSEPVMQSATWGYCCDVMEHIPPHQVRKVLGHILDSASTVYFQICTEEDHFGQTVGHPLHLSVHNADWWRQQLLDLKANILREVVTPGYVIFIASSWCGVDKWMERCSLNVPIERIRANIRENLSRNYREVHPHSEQERECVVLAGGPSLNHEIETIKSLREAGAALVTVNGTYEWALQNGLKPSATVMIDSRDFMQRMVQPVTEGCWYMLASQVSPLVFQSVPAEQIWMFHSASSQEHNDYIEATRTELGIGGDWYVVPGGSTVMLRALPLLRMLGFKRFHIFGFDSCIMDGAHHAYAQPENDEQCVLRVRLNNQRGFLCHPWMLSQAREFIDFVKNHGDLMELAVYGGGLIAAILETAAESGIDEVKGV